MDTFFKRHFRKKPAAPPSETFCPPTLRRCSVVITTGKGRRRSSTGLPSSTLAMQRRCSVTQTPALPLSLPASSGRAGRKDGRRRSSTTTPGLSPRFAVQKRRGGKFHALDRRLLGPSILLASLIPLQKADSTEEDSGEEGIEETTEEETDEEDSNLCSSSVMTSSGEISDPQSCASTSIHQKLYAGDL